MKHAAEKMNVNIVAKSWLMLQFLPSSFVLNNLLKHVQQHLTNIVPGIPIAWTALTNVIALMNISTALILILVNE